jgi:hypothetical protein
MPRVRPPCGRDAAGRLAVAVVTITRYATEPVFTINAGRQGGPSTYSTYGNGGAFTEPAYIAFIP